MRRVNVRVARIRLHATPVVNLERQQSLSAFALLTCLLSDPQRHLF